MSYSINDPYKYNDTISITLSDTTMGTGIPVQTVSNTSPGQSSIYDFGNYNTNVYTIGSASDTITLSDWTTNAGWSNSLDVKGDANFEGDIKIKGKSLVESLEKIEEKLAILRPNEELEAKWDQLRDLRKQYMELEKEIIEKEKVWDILKK